MTVAELIALLQDVKNPDATVRVANPYALRGYEGAIQPRAVVTLPNTAEAVILVEGVQ